MRVKLDVSDLSDRNRALLERLLFEVLTSIYAAWHGLKPLAAAVAYEVLVAHPEVRQGDLSKINIDTVLPVLMWVVTTWVAKGQRAEMPHDVPRVAPRDPATS